MEWVSLLGRPPSSTCLFGFPRTMDRGRANRNGITAPLHLQNGRNWLRCELGFDSTEITQTQQHSSHQTNVQAFLSLEFSHWVVFGVIAQLGNPRDVFF